jgi:hypothetical protein
MYTTGLMNCKVCELVKFFKRPINQKLVYSHVTVYLFSSVYLL